MAIRRWRIGKSPKPSLEGNRARSRVGSARMTLRWLTCHCLMYSRAVVMPSQDSTAADAGVAAMEEAERAAKSGIVRVRNMARLNTLIQSWDSYSTCVTMAQTCGCMP